MRRNPEVFLGELEILVEQQVQHILTMAAKWPSDGGRWDRLLERYDVPPSPDRASRPTEAGAPTNEVRAALMRVAELAMPALAHIEVQFSSEIAAHLPLAARVARLHGRVYDLMSDQEPGGAQRAARAASHSPRTQSQRQSLASSL